MDTAQIKILAMGLIAVTGLIGGFLSVRLEKTSGARLWFSLGSAAAGGIFLGAGLIHMLPDAVSGFRGLVPKLEFPIAFVLAALGFLLILLLEKVIMARAEEGLEGSREEERLAAAAGRTGIYPYVLTLALSFHSVLAGVALGAERHPPSVVVILCAVLAHKGSAAFALGVSLFTAGVARAKAMGILAAFCLMTPLGLALGWGFTALFAGKAANAFEAVFDCLAAGTFLYIAVVDIIQEEFFDSQNRYLKFALLFCGVAAMALLALWL